MYRNSAVPLFTAAALLLLMALPQIATAQTDPKLDPANYEIVLAPIVLFRAVPGTGGAIWTTDFWVRNENEETIWFTQGPPVCFFPPCPTPPGILAGKTTEQVTDRQPVAAFRNPGVLIHVQKDAARDVHFSLRLYDARQPSEATELPIVRVSELGSTVQLLNVPIRDDGPVTLRMYDPDEARIAREVRLRVFDMDNDALLAEGVVPLEWARSDTRGFPGHPAYAQVHPLQDAYPELSSADRVRIEISSPVPGFRVWAFASITNERTLHITTVTPQNAGRVD